MKNVLHALVDNQSTASWLCSQFPIFDVIPVANTGYGHMMLLASALWRKSLEEKGFPVYGAFIPTIDQETFEATVKERKMYDAFVRF